MKSVLLLGSSSVGAKYTKKALENLGYLPIFLLKIDEYQGTPRQAIEACEHYEVDVSAIEDIESAINQYQLAEKSIAITSLLDELLPNVCAIAKKYRLIGPDFALSRLAYKDYVVKLIPEFSPPSFFLASQSIDEKKLQAFLNLESKTNKFLLKPDLSAGGVGTTVFSEKPSVEMIKHHITNTPFKKAVKTWLLQANTPGDLLSLEGFVSAGKAVFLGFSKRSRFLLTESTNLFPTDSELSNTVKNQCQLAVNSLISRASFQYGYFHCEFILSNVREDVYLIDGNLGRIAGGPGLEQIALSYGQEPSDVLAHVFDLGLFKASKAKASYWHQKPSKNQTLGILYALEEPSYISSVTEPQNLTAFHTILIDKNTFVPAVGESDSAWIGLLAGFKEKIKKEINQLSIQTDNGPKPPFYSLTDQPVDLKDKKHGNNKP